MNLHTFHPCAHVKVKNISFVIVHAYRAQSQEHHIMFVYSRVHRKCPHRLSKVRIRDRPCAHCQRPYRPYKVKLITFVNVLVCIGFFESKIGAAHRNHEYRLSTAQASSKLMHLQTANVVNTQYSWTLCRDSIAQASSKLSHKSLLFSILLRGAAGRHY